MSVRHSRIQGKDEKEPGSVPGNDFHQLQAVNVRYMEIAISSLSCTLQTSLLFSHKLVESSRPWTLLTSNVFNN